MNPQMQVPSIFEKDIQQAIEILKVGGCTDIFLFGSLVEGEVRSDSDIDLAVRGCPQGKFFHLLGQLLMTLDHSVDLVSLDQDDAFAQHLATEGELLQIG
jgi:predicted nucleotidyltransferase